MKVSGWNEMSETAISQRAPALRFATAVIVLAACLGVGQRCLAQEVRKSSAWAEDADFVADTIRSTHPMPFRRISAQQFDQELAQFKAAAIDLNDDEATVRLMTFVASIRDGHTGLFPATDTRWFPLRCYELADGVFLTVIDKRFAYAGGAKVLSVGGHPVNDVLRLLKSVFPSDNDFGAKQAAVLLAFPRVLHGLGLIPDTKALPLELRLPDGSQKTLLLPSVDGKPGGDWFHTSMGEVGGPPVTGLITAFGGRPPDVYLQDPARNTDLPLHLRGRRAYWFTYLEPQHAMYVQINDMATRSALSKETFAEFVGKLFRAIDAERIDKFIIDIRYNSGGNGDLTNAFVHEIIKRDAINQQGKLFTITGGKTFSAAADLLISLLHHTQTVLVGEPAGVPWNAAGDAAPVTLPNSKLRLTVSTNFHVGGRFKDLSWTIPVQFPAPMTSSDYFGGKDPAVEMILSGEANRTVLGVLKQQGGQAATHLYEDRRKKFGGLGWWQPFIQDQMNDAGYGLLESKRYDDAIAAFRMNADQYPTNWEVWDSLAEGLMDANKFPEAIAAYQKALQISPANWNADAEHKAIAKMQGSVADSK
jgi:Tetratricopeptide repeat